MDSVASDKKPNEIKTDKEDRAERILGTERISRAERISRSSSEGDVNQFPMDLVTDAPQDKLTTENSVREQNEEEEEEDEEHDGKKSRKDRCLAWCNSTWKPCLASQHPLPHEGATRPQRLAHALMCPPHGHVGRWLTMCLTLALFWGVVWALTEHHALPGGNFFGLIALFVLCVLGGMLAERVYLPPLLGMLIMGCLLRNVPRVNVAADIDTVWSGALRNIALVIILTRAGLGLDPVALKKLSWGVVRLAFLPCLVEAVTAAVASHLLLGFPLAWGFMLGFVLAAVSPAVVVPCMLSLQHKRLGVAQGIPTLVIAAASIDDVLAISGFGVVVGIAFSKGDLVLTIFRGPLEAIAGVVYGILGGMLCWCLPHARHTQRTLFQFLLLLLGGLFATFGSRAADISGAGALGCLTMAFVAGLNWRKKIPEGQEMPVNQIFAVLWDIFQPLLFGLIGAEIDINKIDGKTIGLGIAVLIIGLTLRMIASFLAVFRIGLNLKEKLFIPLAWLPKATVQAAIGSLALDTARATGAGPREIHLGEQVVTIAVLVILITAPVGAAAIALAAPRLLRKPPDESQSSGATPGKQEIGHQEETTQII